jgi:hypothetical protein
MKQQLLTYMVQLIGYVLISFGIMRAFGSKWSKKTWAKIDLASYFILSVAGVAGAIFAFEALINASLGRSALEEVAVSFVFKAWIAGGLPLVLSIALGIGIAKRTLEISRF